MAENWKFHFAAGQRVRNLRKCAGMTISYLAEKLDISDSMIGLLERGERKLKFEYLPTLCELFGTTADYVVFGKGSNNTEDLFAGLSAEEIILFQHFLHEYVTQMSPEERTYFITQLKLFLNFSKNRR